MRLQPVDELAPLGMRTKTFHTPKYDQRLALPRSGNNHSVHLDHEPELPGVLRVAAHQTDDHDIVLVALRNHSSVTNATV
jgi:hypothetical protein